MQPEPLIEQVDLEGPDGSREVGRPFRHRSETPVGATKEFEDHVKHDEE